MNTPLEQALLSVVPENIGNKSTMYIRGEYIMGLCEDINIQWANIQNSVSVSNDLRDAMGIPRHDMGKNTTLFLFYAMALLSTEIPTKRERDIIERIIANIKDRLERKAFFQKSENETLEKFIRTIR